MTVSSVFCTVGARLFSVSVEEVLFVMFLIKCVLSCLLSATFSEDLF